MGSDRPLNEFRMIVFKGHFAKDLIMSLGRIFSSGI